MGQQGAPHGLLGHELEGLAGEEVEAVHVVGVVGNGDAPAGLGELHHGLQQDALALLDVLAHGVEVGGELHAGGEEALALLALALAVELLPPLGKEAEGGLIAHQQLGGLAGLIEGVTGGGILPGGVVQAGDSQGLHGLGGAPHQGVEVNAGHGDGQQAHGGEDGEPAADGVGHHEFLIALLVGQALQGALVGVGGGVDAAAGFLLAVLLLQQALEDAEGHGGLGGGAGLGDDVDGEIPVLHQLDGLDEGVGGEAVAHEVDVGGILLLQIVVGRAEQLHNSAGAQIRAADAHDHQGLRVGADLVGGLLDAGKLHLIVVTGQVDPAGEVAAGAVALFEHDAGLFQAVLTGGEPVLGQEAGGVVEIELYHSKKCLLIQSVLIVYTKLADFPSASEKNQRSRMALARASSFSCTPSICHSLVYRVSPSTGSQPTPLFSAGRMESGSVSSAWRR